MNFDWTKEVYINWRSHVIKEQDVGHSVIRRLLSNIYCTPLSERALTHHTPLWSPQDPFGTSCNGKFQNRMNFIPGQLPLSAYPQVSELTKQQHQQGVRVVCAKHKNVQPKLYAKPNAHDYKVFEEIKEVYEAEQKKFLDWAKHLWFNGGCIRALRPKPIIEQVYEAEFRMRAHNVRCWPQNYALAAQIPLETNKDAFELKHQADLLSVNVQELPTTDYPEVMECNLSILLKSCPMPEPCKEHICKFVLPYEDYVSSLPMSEIHRELAHFAISHDSSFVASENALRCLVETDRSWHIPVTVIEAIHPEHGDRRTVIVLGSEFGVQKECSTQRTYRAYKHLLHHAFVPSIGQYKLKASDKQPSPLKNHIENISDTEKPIVKRANRFVSLDDDLEVSSDEDDNNKLLIDDNEPNGKQPVDSYEPNRLLIDDNQPDGETEQLDSCEPNRLTDESIDSDPEANECFDDHHEPHFDEPSSEPDGMIIADMNETNVQPTCNYDAYEPKFTNNFSEDKPSYSHSVSDTDIQKAKLSICKNLYSRMESENTDHYASKLLETKKACVDTNKNYSKHKEVNQDTFAKQNNSDDLSDDAIKNIKIDLIKDIYSRMEKNANKEVYPELIESKVTSESKDMNEHVPRLIKTRRITLNLIEVDTKDLTHNKNSEINTKLSYTPMTNENNKSCNMPTKHIAPINSTLFDTKTNEALPCKSNNGNTSETNKQKNEATKILSPIKPCSVSVRSLSISEAKAYNLTAIINDLNTVSPIKDQSSSERNDKKINNNSEEEFIPRKIVKARVSLVKSYLKPIANLKDPIRNRKGSYSTSNDVFGIANGSDLEKDLEELDSGLSANKRAKLMVDQDDSKPRTARSENISSAKNNSGKLDLCELFGDESDSDEPIYSNLNNAKNITQLSLNQEILASTDLKVTEILDSDKIKTDNRHSNLGDPIDTPSSIESPVNTKRKLSFSDTSTTEPELNTSTSSSESEESILGFQNGSAVTNIHSQKKSLKQSKLSCTYSLRSRKPTHRTNVKKSKPGHASKNTSGITERDPHVTRRRQISYSFDSDGSKKVNKQIKTKNVPLRRSRRFSTCLNSEGNDDSHKDETNKVQKKTESTEELRRSRRYSERSSASENIQPKSKTKAKKTIKRSSRRFSLRTSNKEMTLKISERTKRALRRTMNLESSDDDNSSDDAETNNQKSDRKPIQTKLDITNSTRPKNNSIADTSDSDSDENEPIINIFHFTTNQTDTEDSDTDNYLTIDDSQSENASTVTEENKTAQNHAKDNSDKVYHIDKLKTRNENNYAVDESATVPLTLTNNTNSTVGDKTDTTPMTAMSETNNSKTTQVKTDSTVDNKNASVSTTSANKPDNIALQAENDSTVIDTSAAPVTSQPKVETKQNEAKRILQTHIIRTDERNRRRISEDIPIQNQISNSKENTLPQETIHDIIGVHRCTCKGTLFAVPPPRSFKKWQVKNKTSNIAHDLIVHSAHKARQGEREVVLEPIVEYQPELGATRPSAGKLRALTLALAMRESPRLVNVRVNHENGNVIVIDSITKGEFIERHGDHATEVADRLHTALDQLRYLVPGQYILAHHPSHGPNAMLYSTKGDCVGIHSLQLRRDNINMSDAEDALHVKTAPDLAPIPLPFHKHRGILPLAFTPNQCHVSTNKKITAALSKRAKLPPHGIQWPKKKKKKARKPRQDRQPQANSTQPQDL